MAYGFRIVTFRNALRGLALIILIICVWTSITTSKVQNIKTSIRDLDLAKPDSNSEYYDRQTVTNRLSRSGKGTTYASYISDAAPNTDHLPASNPSSRSLVNNKDEKTRSQTNKQSWELVLSRAYARKWVGFRDMDGRNCKRALASEATNDMFQPKVKRQRTFAYTTDPRKCWKFRDFHGFNRYPEASEEEKRFPIAFIILFHNNVDQVMFLLRAIYRPHNVYCLTLDAKNNEDVISQVKTVFQCLPNVFVASKLEKIVYAGFSRLMADIHCMHDLLEHPVPWKYVINMPGQQFPLRTNLELVKILTMWNGSNDIQGMPSSASIPNRYKIKHVVKTNPTTGYKWLESTREKLDPPPHNITVVKGSTYGTFSRDFVHFALHHPIARALLNYSMYFCSPDEYFWSTLQHTDLVPVPGGFTAPKTYVTSYSVWRNNGTEECHGKFVRRICIFSPEDLPNIIEKSNLFANKFYVYFQPAALHCLDEWLYNRTVTGVVGDLAIYGNLKKQIIQAGRGN